MVSLRHWGGLLGLVLCACSTTPKTKTLVVPDEMRRSPVPSRRPGADRDRGPPLTPPGMYVLRMAEHGRVWEMELPEDSGGYEVRMPLSGTGPVEMLTSADEEMLAESVLGAKAKPADPDRVVDANRAARTKSYLGGVARVKEMYASRRYELALIELVELEKEYPQDARLLAMKGSIYLKMNQPKLARKAWERALSLNPDDAGVAEALRAINDGAE